MSTTCPYIVLGSVAALAVLGACGNGTPDDGAPLPDSFGEDSGVGTSTGGRGVDGATPAPGDGGTGGGDGGASAAFRHPGVLVNQAQLDLLKGNIAANMDPWATAFAAAQSSGYASASYTATPVADVDCGPYSNPDVGCSAEKSDASAAYTQALLWYFTGDQAYAAKAIAIMNAWSAVITMHTNSNAPLQSAWTGSVWPRAAEIIRYTNAGWSSEDVAKFETMLKTAYLPYVIHGAPSDNGNWELSMAEAVLGIGVFLDDKTTFATGLALWRGRVPAYIYLSSDGPLPVPPPGANITGANAMASYWNGQSTFMNGLCQETCRDLGHTQYGFAAMIDGAETARIQGIDLYSEQAARIVAGYEFNAGFLDGNRVPNVLCGGALNAVSPDPTWEIGYNEFVHRLGMTLPNTRTLVLNNRPTGVDHMMNWETLTHCEVGSVGL